MEPWGQAEWKKRVPNTTFPLPAGYSTQKVSAWWHTPHSHMDFWNLLPLFTCPLRPHWLHFLLATSHPQFLRTCLSFSLSFPSTSFASSCQHSLFFPRKSTISLSYAPQPSKESRYEECIGLKAQVKYRAKGAGLRVKVQWGQDKVLQRRGNELGEPIG